MGVGIARVKTAAAAMCTIAPLLAGPSMRIMVRSSMRTIMESSLRSVLRILFDAIAILVTSVVNFGIVVQSRRWCVFVYVGRGLKF